jgi:hypothetical protein
VTSLLEKELYRIMADHHTAKVEAVAEAVAEDAAEAVAEDAAEAVAEDAAEPMVEQV